MDEGSEDVVDNSLLFFKTLSVSEISDLLLETTLSFWDLWRNNPVILQRRLWDVSDIIRKVSKDTSLFVELSSICTGSVVDKALTIVKNLPDPFTIYIFCGILAWLGPQCKEYLKKDTKEMCDRVAEILFPTLKKLKTK
ncbi:LH2 [Barthadenovirus sternae]|nr:LH2 [Tern adenovirus]UJZ92501.1 LH2 [Tern atadenovirus 1]